MRLKGLRLKGFRSFGEETSIDFEDITAIVGLNDAGKSTIMEALAIFFEEQKIDQDDANVRSSSGIVSIICDFDDLPPEIITDSTYSTSLSDEYLVSPQGYFSVEKKYNTQLATPKLISVNAIALHPTRAKYDDLLTLKKTELRARAKELGVDLTNVQKNANAPVRTAIWSNEKDLDLQERTVSLESEGGKQVWTAISPYLPAFALFKADRASTDQDAEAQDPLNAAIRDALNDIQPDLEKIIQHVEAKTRRIANATVEKIREMDPELAGALEPHITTKKWDSLFRARITGEDGIPLNKRGSGVKRVVLLNFFRAQAEQSAVQRDTGSIIYAVEEPETSQHPRNQRMLLAALRDLAGLENRQVIITTHTPMLARSLPYKCLRYIERDSSHPNGRSILNGGEDTNDQIANSLGVLPDHNVRLFVGVEGAHDIAFLKTISNVLSKEDPSIPDLESLEVNGELIFLPLGGSNLAHWKSRLQPFRLREYHIYDRDTPPGTAPKYGPQIDEINSRERCEARATEKREMENYLHPAAIEEAYAELEIEINLPDAFDDFDDVPLIVARRVHESTSSNQWPDEDSKPAKKKVSKAKAALNRRATALMSMQRLNEVDGQGEIRGWLSDIDAIIRAERES